MPNKKQQILDLLAETGVLRPRDLEQIGISGIYLNKLHAEGILDRPSRGLYTLAQANASEHRSIVEASKRVPHGVVALLSALRFHELTTQSPFQVWIAIAGKARQPNIDYPPLRVVRFSQQSFSFGIETPAIEGVSVRVYSAAKTVADCFKFRNKIGLDVAIEALRDCLRTDKATMDEIWNAAKICRVTQVMRPYMDAMA
jgi:predicted transcriptional regulator of viral defense system